MKQIKEQANENICKVLVGNKKDSAERVVTYEEGQKLAESYGVKFFETSAKDDINVTEAFESITEEIAEATKAKISMDNDSEIIVLEDFASNEPQPSCVSRICK